MIMNQNSEFLMKIRNIVFGSGVSLSFSEEAIKETSQIESRSKWPFIGRRLDLRSKTSFTLGSMEVAFSVEKDGEDFILCVHSADVAELIPVGSALDKVAFSKGRSVFFPEKTYHMIPEPISVGLCSLREGEESFTVSVIMRINNSGKVKSIKFAESVIKVTANCESKEVESLFFAMDISSVGFLRYKYYSVLEQLENMFVAGAILKMARENRGATDIDTAIRTFSRKGIRGNIKSVGFEKLSDPDRLVREIISAMGVEIAKYFDKRSIPCPYRRRAPMAREDCKRLRSFLLSVCVDAAKVSDKTLAAFAANVAHGNRSEEFILAKVKELLPASECSLEAGYHGGLGTKHYVRFAYPVSRYGDLAVQRLIKVIANSGDALSEADMKYMEKCALLAVMSVNENEPKIKAVEKRISDLYVLDHMKNNSSKTYMGTVWNVSEDGIEVCLDNSCKGFLKKGYAFAQGQRLILKVAEIDLDKELVLFDVLSVSEDFSVM